MIQEMFSIMYQHRGVGLAANQVNLPLRLFVANPTGEKDSGEEYVFLNPVIRRATGSVDSDEGCLSLPGLNAPIKRNKMVVVNAYSIDGKEIDIQVEGFLARIIQHEIDHLDGVLFIDRMSDASRRTIEEELIGFEHQFELARRGGKIPEDQELVEQREALLDKYCR